MILLDTSLLSLAFRRRRRGESEPRVVSVLRRMVTANAPLSIPGIVLQELLSGIQSEPQFSRLKQLIEGFPIIMAERAHHFSAARISNSCSQKGVTVSSIDCLIAAIAIAHNAPLFTLDDDFSKMTPHCGLKLFRPSP